MAYDERTEAVAGFKFDESGFEKQIKQQFDQVEREANKAAAQHSTPKDKASAFARVLQKRGIEGRRIRAP